MTNYILKVFKNLGNRQNLLRKSFEEVTTGHPTRVYIFFLIHIIFCFTINILLVYTDFEFYFQNSIKAYQKKYVTLKLKKSNRKYTILY